MEFNSILKKLRTEKGISQRTLAKDLDVAPTAISHYEKGTKPPTLENVVKLAAYFGVSTDTLLGIDSPKAEKYDALSGCIPLIATLMEHYNFEWDIENQCFHVEDPAICKLMNDWQNLYQLCKNGTIGKDLYDLWLKDQIEKHKNIATFEAVSESEDLPF